jgi:uncharacterized membrane protein
MNAAKRSIGFLRTTAIGGLLFLLPLVVVGALIGQVVPIVMAIAKSLSEFLPGFAKSPNGIGLLLLIATAVLLLLCFGAGIVARHSLARTFTQAFEKRLMMLFPRYAIIKDQMADTIGGDERRPTMKPVLVHFDEWSRIAFETERSEALGYVAVYLPGSPDAWSGLVALVSIDRVQPLEAEFGPTVSTCEQLGRGAELLLRQTPDIALFRG